MARTLSTAFTYIRFTLSVSVWVFAITSVFAHSPDREDVFRLADADLDVGFFINPAPWPSSFCGLRRNINGPRCLNRRRRLIVKEIKQRAIELHVLIPVLRDFRLRVFPLGQRLI